jgi:Kef-type K+ transport system membrane component KefB
MSTAGIVTAAVPFALVFLACGLWFALTQRSLAGSAFFRDAILLGTAGAMTARSAPLILKGLGEDTRAVRRIWSVVEVEQITGVAGLMLVAAYFRPQGALVSWQLPGTAWLFITLGVGTTMGVLIHGVFGKIKSGPEFSLLLLGSVAFTAGIASFLRLSPIVVCFIAGVVMVNLPGGPKPQVREALLHLERPVYLLFLVVVGSLWQGWEWQGWTLMVLFVAARLLGKWVSVLLCQRSGVSALEPSERTTLVFGPVGALSIAIVVNAQDLYLGPTIPWMITAVVGGAIVTEVIVQTSTMRRRQAPPDTNQILGQA